MKDKKFSNDSVIVGVFIAVVIAVVIQWKYFSPHLFVVLIPFNWIWENLGLTCGLILVGVLLVRFWHLCDRAFEIKNNISDLKLRLDDMKRVQASLEDQIRDLSYAVEDINNKLKVK